MRLVSPKRYYGLRWKGMYPPIPWRLLLDAALLLSLLVGGWMFVAYMAESANLADKHAVAVYQAETAEKVLAHCLNGGSLLAGNEMIMCGKAAMVKL